MVQKIHYDMESDRSKCEDERRESQGGKLLLVSLHLNLNIPLQYLDDFSRALATEVCMLFKEVGRIHEERRALQQCVTCVFTPSLHTFRFTDFFSYFFSQRNRRVALHEI